MPSELVMDRLDQRNGALGIAELEEIADGERVGPQIAALPTRTGQSGALRKARHQVTRGNHDHNVDTDTEGSNEPLPRARARAGAGFAVSDNRALAKTTLDDEGYRVLATSDNLRS